MLFLERQWCKDESDMSIMKENSSKPGQFAPGFWFSLFKQFVFYVALC
jgi:hypothetical protein